MNDAPDFDAYAPPEFARRVETVGVAKARMALLPLLTLAVVAGAFVAFGFEHSVANMYLIPIGFIAGADLDLGGFTLNLVAVSLGNVIGGGVLVAPVYWLVYIRPTAPKAYARRKKMPLPGARYPCSTGPRLAEPCSATAR